WLRMSLATTRTLPSVVSREASFSLRRVRCSSSRACDVITFQKISTREEVLFTCWPPAPEDRETRTSSSLRGIDSDSLTGRTFCGAVADGSLTSLSPAEQLQGSYECHDPPHHDDEDLRGHASQRCSLEHVSSQRIVQRREWKDLDIGLHCLGEICRR